MIRTIKSKDKLNFINYCINFEDKYEDTYITINRERKFLSDSRIAEIVFNNALKRGDKVFIIDEEDEIKGILIVTGYSDKFPRKYIKILADSEKEYNNLITFLGFNFKDKELFAKLKNNNPLAILLKRKGFDIAGMRGKEVLLQKKAIKGNYNIILKE